MFEFICPICKSTLKISEKSYKCENNHCFDIAKQGYVNLLISQKSSKKRHGDDGLMLNSRRDFLNKGYYSELKDGIIEILKQYDFSSDSVIADLGCGECYYTDSIQKEFDIKSICGIDISKQALICGSKRNNKISLAVASTSDLPIKDNYCDAVISVFAPVSISEIHRILKNNGIWVKAYPLENHLYGLKNAIYTEPVLNEVDENYPDGFILDNYSEIKYNITLTENEDIQNLFKMTPYYYKTGINDQKKFQNINYLETEIEFGISVYKKEIKIS